MASTVASQSLHLQICEQLRRNYVLLTSCLLLLTSITSCTSSKKLTNQPQPNLLADSNLLNAHIGISIYDPAENKYIYTHQADKYFIPASNTKLYTCYAAMKHLGDSLVGIKYNLINDTTIQFEGTGDPTFLHSDFKKQPVFDFLRRFKKIEGVDMMWRGYLHKGWSWDDYLEPYMVQLTQFPIYGNVFKIKLEKGKGFTVIPDFYPDFYLSIPEYNVDYSNGFNIHRDWDSNNFTPYTGNNRYMEVPFVSSGFKILSFLKDTLNDITVINRAFDTIRARTKFYSQPTDSVLKPMMHRSDNFFAEQTLLMVSNEILGVMNDEKIIDSLLKTDFKDLPQKPRWVDGSGLSRYNLFSPNDMVFVLNKMKNEFDWNRITTILATGGEGTLESYYHHLKGRIFAKTGTISNNICLSGFLITKQNKTLIFSVMVNNHMGSASQIRKVVEKFLTYYAENF
jgi:D-alanyl-D-alanine carboxypeptidase/D-alanyl-D-alanine-endopeptidase (penicillin-binding protein 4)